MSEAFRPVTSAWSGKISKAWEQKMRDFGSAAEECMQFFTGPYDWLYGKRGVLLADDDAVPAPTFRMTVNKVSELVQLFGPALYHRNPIRKVTPRKAVELPEELLGLLGIGTDPAATQQFIPILQEEQVEATVDKARAMLLEAYLNYTPGALDLKAESRWAIDEAMIKGMGLLYTETYTPPGSQSKMVGSFYDSVDNLVIDPDSESLRDATWIGRRRWAPYWQVERTFGLPAGALKNHAHMESVNQQSAVNAMGLTGDFRRKMGLTNDILVYWEIYSKMGPGGLLSGIDPRTRDLLAPFGDYAYLAVCNGVDYPLNIPKELCDQLSMLDPLDPNGQGVIAQVQQLLEWPTPYWADDGWPFTPIAFHWTPRKAWPHSHVWPALGELKFLNWAYSMLASKVRIACRDFIAIAKSAGEEIKDRIKHGSDYTVVEVDQIHESIDKMVKFLQHPGFNPEIYTVIRGIAENFDKRTGLTELVYGQSARQIRSASEATIRDDAASIRPDDMANRVEDAMSEISRKEALACRWHLTGSDVRNALGVMGGHWWDILLSSSDPSRIVHQLEYRIEAGSAKKPNKATEAMNMGNAMQYLFQPLLGYAQMSGNVGPINALIGDWAKSIDLEARSYLLPPAPPPPPPPADPQPPGSEASVPPGAPVAGPASAPAPVGGGPMQ